RNTHVDGGLYMLLLRGNRLRRGNRLWNYSPSCHGSERSFVSQACRVGHTTRQAAFSSLPFWFAASALAVIFLLVLPNTLQVAVSPDSDFLASLIDSSRLLHLAVQQPTNQRDLVDSN